jgi:hypothetical protein
MDVSWVTTYLSPINCGESIQSWRHFRKRLSSLFLAKAPNCGPDNVDDTFAAILKSELAEYQSSPLFTMNSHRRKPKMGGYRSWTAWYSFRRRIVSGCPFTGNPHTLTSILI